MDSVKSSVVRDNLISGDYPLTRGEVTIAASQTLARGAVIGKITVAAGTAAADGGNTGDGALTAFALAAGGPAIVGNYLVTCSTAVANGGVFDITDPNGGFVGQITIPTSSNITFTGAGITFNLADGATDFAAGDFFTLPVAAGSGQGKLLDIASTDGSQVFYGILLEAVTTGVAVTKAAPVAISGGFHSQGLTLGGSTVVADILAAARDANCYIKTSYVLENVEV